METLSQEKEEEAMRSFRSTARRHVSYGVGMLTLLAAGVFAAVALATDAHPGQQIQLSGESSWQQAGGGSLIVLINQPDVTPCSVPSYAPSEGEYRVFLHDPSGVESIIADQ